MNDIRISHPITNEHFAGRDQLLQEALRPQPLPFQITAEYPLVLNHADSAYSYCVTHGGNIVAHANLWPRVLIDRENGAHCDVGLIGNVATKEQWRGQGIMSKLLEHLKMIAADSGIKALYLWSDLSQFYQNHGFRSLGCELRWSFSLNRRLRGMADTSWEFSAVPISQIDEAMLQNILDLRSAARVTLRRSPAEMRELLAIPATFLLIGRQVGSTAIACYAVIGRGYDLAGVIHEWGATEPNILIACIRHIIDRIQMPEIILLTPGKVSSTWHTAFADVADQKVEHPLALVCTLDQNERVRSLVERSFIWGLDSI